MMATIYYTNGNQEERQPANGTDWQLEELQAIVGGYIEIVGLHDGRLMILNEEGKLHWLPINQEATRLFNEGGRVWYDPILGDVLVCADTEVR